VGHRSYATVRTPLFIRHFGRHSPHHLHVAAHLGVDEQFDESQRRDLAVLEVVRAVRESANPARNAVVRWQGFKNPRRVGRRWEGNGKVGGCGRAVLEGGGLE
jgi:hypothetical protein